MLLSPKFDPIQGRELCGLPSFLWGGAGGVVSCGSRLVHTPNALNILAGMIILASFYP